jgi:outer membrane biosynthesis protein TonB
VIAKSSPPVRPTPQPAPPPAQLKPAQPTAKPEPKPDAAEEGKDVKAKEPARKELAKREEEPLQQVSPKKKTLKPVERTRAAPEPKEKEVIRLAKKAPAKARPMPPAFPRMGAGVSAANMSGNAEITGEISFGATRHFFGDYLLKMKQAVETEWMSNLISRYSGIERSTAAIDFKIQPDGRVTDIEIESNEGDPYFPLVCVSSIQSAQPFDEIRYSEIRGLPEELIDRPLSVRFTFRYN